MYRSIIILFLCFSQLLFGQTIDQENFESLNFRNIGPAGMSGRITSIDVNLSDDDIIYVGSASGGVWKSINGGINWEPIFDDQEALSIGSIKINQKNPSEIWVGTGEGNPRNSSNVGAGIYKSLDAGKTWKRMGLEKTKAIHRIIIHRDNPEIVFAGAIGSPWGPHPERGVYRTKDGGKTWKQILYTNDKTGVADMVVDPSNPNKIVVAMWEHMRTPWDFTSGGKGSGLWITYNGGDDWKQLTDKEGLPKGDLGRMGVAFAASKPDKIYALIEAKKNGLYQSVDGGEHWTKVSDKNIGNRPFYYAELYVDPQNENRIFNLWSYLSLSEDGGKTFKTIADYGNNVHPDHHALWIHPEKPSFVIDGNDGGLNISRDGGENWHFVSNLPVGQFYHVNIDDDFPYNVYGGMQDNGSWVGPGFVLKRGGIRNYDWQELYFGDGFDVSPYPADNRYGYAMSQGGNLAYYDKLTGKSRYIRPNHEEGKKLRYNWNAALAQDPFSDCGVYYASQYVHFSEDCGYSWMTISPDLTTNDTTKQHQDKSGGLTIDATNAENHTTILCVSPSPVDKKVIWVGTDDGNLQLTTDGGANWKKLNARIKGLPVGGWIPQIEVSKTNAGEAFVIANNYRKNDYKAYAFHTTDFGTSWKQIVDFRNVKYFTTSIVQDPVEPNLLFLGTDGGLYISFDKGGRWTHWTEGFPKVQIRDLKIQESFGDLVIGTFGRSLWVLDDISPLRMLAGKKNFRLNDFALVDSPDAFLTSQRSYDGIRFSAQSEFIGKNKSTRAKINYWKKPKDKNAPPKKEKKEKDAETKQNKKKTKDELIIKVLNKKGDTVRSFTHKTKEGYNSFYWRMEQDGVVYPSRRKKEEDVNKKPGGYRVLPGQYKVIVMDNDVKDSILINVKQDPRIDQTDQDLKDIRSVYDAYYEDVTQATESFEQLKEAKKSLKIVEQLMATAQDSIQDKIKDKNKEVRKEIQRLEGLYMLQEDLKGIHSSQGKLNSYLYRAGRYIGSSWKKPGPNALIAVEKAGAEVVKVTKEIDAFINEGWEEYETFIAAFKLSPFKSK